MPVSTRRRLIAARCRLTGELKAAVAPLIGRDGSHGLDDCTDEQRRFRAQLALFLLNAAPVEGWDAHKRRVAAQRVWSAWAAFERFLPYPDTLVVTTVSPGALRRALTGRSNNAEEGMPGLRYDHTDPPSFIHIPTKATLRVHVPPRPLLVPNTLLRGEAANGQGLAITPREQRLLDSLPRITVEAEQLLAALLVRLPLADPDGIWTLSKHHLLEAADSPEDNSHFLIGDGPSWHYRWNGPIQAFDIAAALTDTVTGLADAAAVLRPGQPLTVSYGAAKLNLHGEV